MKHSILFFLLITTAGFYSCANNTTMTIEPIDKELNEQLLTGKNLDTRLFSTKELLQYYEVSGFDGQSPNSLQEKIDGYVDKNFKIQDLATAEQITYFFYKKEMGANYGKYVYETARDTETGLIAEYKDNLLSLVRFVKIAGKDDSVLRYRTVYNKEKVLLDLTDTLSIKE